MTKQPFELRELIIPLLPMWLLAWGLGIVMAVSVIGLLMVSGWFITMAGIVGIVSVGSHSFNYLVPSALIRTFAITRTFGRYGDLVVSHQAIFELLKRLRVRFFNEFANLDSHIRSQVGSSDAQYRLVKDIDTLDEFVLKIVSPWVMGLVIVIGLSALLGMMLAWWLIIPLWLILVVSVALNHVSVRLAYKEHCLQSARKTELLNVLPALTQLLVWGRWQQAILPAIDADKQLRRVYGQSHQVRQIAMLLVQWLIVVLALGVLHVGIQQVNNQISVAVLLALLLGVFGVIELVVPLVADPLSWGRSKFAKERLNELLATSKVATTNQLSSVSSLRVAALSAKQQGSVFGVSNLSFEVQAGTPLVITGVSGGGKSTLLDVLAGELMPIQGDVVLMDKSGQFADLMQSMGSPNSIRMGYLSQRVDIFDQSLEDNLRLGNINASDDELWHVLGLVGLDDWVRLQPSGIKTHLGEYGAMISGGQARRIALARLLLSPKNILLLDEPFAGLDGKSRHYLWQALKFFQQGGLLIVVSHHNDIIDECVEVLKVGEPVWLP